MADRIKLCFDRCWEVMGGVLIGETYYPPTFLDLLTTWCTQKYTNAYSNCQWFCITERARFKICMTVQEVGMDVCANFGDSGLKPSEASFSAIFRTLITSDRN